MQEVTDPEILKQLNEGQGTEVTDPNLLKQLNGEEGPGILKSGALGFMSGVPGAESAISWLESLSPDKTYEQAHQELENAKNEAWNAHPVAYGAGKTTGIVGTGAAAALAAPATIPGALAAGAITGAASGADIAERPADIMAKVTKGAATGAVTGAVLQGASNLLTSGLSAAGKAGVASIGAPTRADVTSYLENPEAINNALDKTGLANKLAETTTGLGKETEQMSANARNLINPEATPISAPIKTPSAAPTNTGLVDQFGKPIIKAAAEQAPTDVDTLKPIFDQLKERYLQNGVPKSDAAQAAVNALDKQYDRLAQIAQANGGKLTEADLKDQIVELQNIARSSFGEGSDVAASKGAMRNLSGALNKELKTANEPYAEAIQPVAERKELLGDIADKFKLEETPEGYKPTDATIGKVQGLIGDQKPESQAYLEHLKELTGIDFLDLAKKAEIAGRFNQPGGGQGANVLYHTLGYGAGAISNIPGGRLVGSLLGGLVGHSVDGGRMAKSILDQYIKFRGSSANAALNKYGAILANAAKQGGNQLAATHFVLSTSDPDYQKLVNEQAENINQ